MIEKTLRYVGILLIFSQLVSCECEHGWSWAGDSKKRPNNQQNNLDSGYYIGGRIVRDTAKITQRGQYEFGKILKLDGLDYTGLKLRGYGKRLIFIKSTFYWHDVADSLPHLRSKDGDYQYLVLSKHTHKTLHMLTTMEVDSAGTEKRISRNYELKKYCNCRLAIAH